MRRPAKNRVLLYAGAAALAYHAAALVVAALPDAPFRRALVPAFRWYVESTAQWQPWTMFVHPYRTAFRLDLTARTADGVETRPWGDTGALTDRRLYLLLNLGQKKQDRFGEALLDELHRNAPELRKLTLTFATAPLPPYEDYLRGGEIGAERLEWQVERAW